MTGATSRGNKSLPGIYLHQSQRLLSATQRSECNCFQAGCLHQVLRRDRRVEMELVTERLRWGQWQQGRKVRGREISLPDPTLNLDAQNPPVVAAPAHLFLLALHRVPLPASEKKIFLYNYPWALWWRLIKGFGVCVLWRQMIGPRCHSQEWDPVCTLDNLLDL